MGWKINDTDPLWKKALSKFVCNLVSRKTWVFFIATGVFVWTTKLDAKYWLIIALAFAGFNTVLDAIITWFKGKNGGDAK